MIVARYPGVTRRLVFLTTSLNWDSSVIVIFVVVMVWGNWGLIIAAAINWVLISI